MKKQSGLTLIEVLIALAIVAIAMTAIIKATSQNIRGSTYLKDKTIAMWVGQQVLNEARIGLLQPGKDSAGLKATTKMLNTDWYWQLSQSETPNKRIKKIEVRVFTHESDDEDEAPTITMETYLYHAD
jgi:general secretion pathway protein I